MSEYKSFKLKKVKKNYIVVLFIYLICIFFVFRAHAFLRGERPPIQKTRFFKDSNKIKILKEKKKQALKASHSERDSFNKKHGNRWKVRYHPRRGIPKHITGYRTKPMSGRPQDIAHSFIKANESFLQINTDELKLRTVMQRKRRHHVCFEQEYRGIPVENSKTLIHLTDQGEIIALRLAYHPQIELSIIPHINKEQAITQIKQLFGNKLVPTEIPQIRLVIYPDTRNGEYYLAWKIKIFSYNPAGLWIVYVNAASGDVLFMYNDLRMATSGLVRGKIFPSTGDDVQREYPMPNQWIGVYNNSVSTTNVRGEYTSSSDGTVYAAMEGSWVNVDNEDEGDAFYVDDSSTWDEVSYTISSSHPYDNNYDNTWTITHPGAQKIRVHFSDFETEAGYDFVYIKDSNDNTIGTYHGDRDSFWSSVVDGDTIKIQFVTDNLVTAQGFDIDSYSYFVANSAPSMGSSWIWDYETSDSHCDEVNMFYHINVVHDYFKQTLSFTGMDYQVKATVHFMESYANAFYNPDNDSMYFGDGDGVTFLDFSRACDVIYHEYTHGVQDHIYDLAYYGQSGAMMEAWSDYFACSITNDSVIGEWALPSAYQRNLTSLYVYPDDWADEVHDDGRIYGGALWEIRESLGKETADKITFESLFFQPDNFQTGLDAMKSADEMLFPGTTHFSQIETAFSNHGIPPDLSGDTYEPNGSFSQAYGPLNSGSVYLSKIYHVYDEDYYYVAVGAGQISLSLTNIPQGNDYDIYLFDATKQLIGSSDNLGNSDESIVYSAAAGIYYIYIISYDGFSTTESYSLQVTFTAGADGTAPTGIPGVPRDRGAWGTSEVAFRWTIGTAADGESGISGYSLHISTDQGTGTIFNGEVGSYLVKTISDCVHGLTYYARVRAYNGSGLFTNYSMWSDGITIDTTVPNGLPSIPLDDGLNSPSISLNFYWDINTSTDPESGIVGYHLQVSSVPADTINTFFDQYVGNVSIQIVSNCANQETYYARVKAQNGAGSYTVFSAWSDGITVQDTAPQVTIQNPEDGINLTGSVIILCSATDTDKVRNVELYIDNEFFGQDSTFPYSWEWNTLRWPDGIHTIRVVASDELDHVSEDSHEVNTNNDISIIFSDDMESGRSNWSHYGISGDNITDNWSLSTSRWHSSSHSWYSGSEIVTWNNGGDTALVSRKISLERVEVAYLSYVHWHYFDNYSTGYSDGGIVEITTDDGDTWVQISPVGGYSGKLIQGYDNPLEGYNAFGGQSGGWRRVFFDLSTYHGQEVYIRFRVGWDYATVTAKEGWYIDDFRVTGIDYTPDVRTNSLVCLDNVFDPLKGGRAIIHYNSHQSGRVTVKIYNLIGELAKVIVDEDVPTEYIDVLYWDGTNSDGDIVASGIYLVHIEAPGFRDTKKIAVVK